MTGHVDHVEQDRADLAPYLRLYRLEPLGWLLERSRLPLPVVGALFVAIYFGVLLVMHAQIGDPAPATIAELFGHPTTRFYYPNLIGITYDLIGNPLYFVLLVIMRSYVPPQFVRLQQAGMLVERRTDSPVVAWLGRLVRARWMQIALTTVLPLLVGLLLYQNYVRVFPPATLPDQYAVFLSLLGNYVKLVLLVQTAYLFLILSRHRIHVNLQPNHPDQCAGLSPFGNLALISYAFLFLLAAVQAVGTSAGGTALERALTSAGGATALIYLWLLFPLAVIFVFERLLYQPHRTLVAALQAQLEASGQAWVARHRALLDQAQSAAQDAPLPNLKAGLEQLEAWASLEQVLREMPTWPISRGTLRLLGTLVNPLLPMLLPAISALLQP